VKIIILFEMKLNLVLQQKLNGTENCNYLWLQMIPDYPHKIFFDRRNKYSLLMLALAMDSVL